jgi:hypothetical protein
MQLLRSSLVIAVLAAVGLAAFASIPGLAQSGPGAMPPAMGQGMPGPDVHHPMMDHSGGAASGKSGHPGAMAMGRAPGLPGQDAFGAIQEIVAMLEADPKTDWSKVNLAALREHLVDMNEVVLKADAAEKPIDGGLEIAVTGSGRTLTAIQRMIPAHAQEIDGLKGWSAKATLRPEGVLLTVTASDPREVEHIRGLGFIGVLASGSHHQRHHFAMAKGEMPH